MTLPVVCRYTYVMTLPVVCRYTYVSAMTLPAYVSIRQHTSAYAGIRQHTSAYVGIRVQGGSNLEREASNFDLFDYGARATLHRRPCHAKSRLFVFAIELLDALHTGRRGYASAFVLLY